MFLVSRKIKEKFPLEFASAFKVFHPTLLLLVLDTRLHGFRVNVKASTLAP